MDTHSAQEILSRLDKTYPAAACELNYTTVFELLVAVILSAQCTDKRVNKVTAELFLQANTPQQFLELGQAQLERMIYTCGFYRQKAKSILSASEDILTKHGGEVPHDAESLMRLSGVGRKTANVVLSVAFGEGVIAVDTHVFRVSRRLGLSDGKNPHKVEMDLENLLPKNDRARAHHLLIFHGRYCCKAQRPLCQECPVKEFCTVYPNDTTVTN